MHSQKYFLDDFLASRASGTLLWYSTSRYTVYAGVEREGGGSSRQPRREGEGRATHARERRVEVALRRGNKPEASPNVLG